MEFFYAFVIPLVSGLITGVVIGAVAQRTNFCSTGAIGDILLANDWRRARSWIMAAAVALLGTFVGAVIGFVPLDRNIYSSPFANPVLAIPGGLAFGYGMAVAGGCVQRALVRIGGGSLRSLVVLAAIALSGEATKTLLNMTNIWSATAWPVEIPSTLAQTAVWASRPDAFVITLTAAGLIALALLVFCLKDKWFRTTPEHLWGGVVIGLAVTFGWWNWDRVGSKYVSGLNLFSDLMWTVQQALPPPAPVILPAICRILSIGAVLFGMIIGSFFVALTRRDLMIDRFADRDDVKRNLLGGALMGFGGTLIAGCTFGGLSGFAVLSFAAFIAIAAMIAGCVWGIRALEAGSAWGGLKLCIGRKAS
jgi:uncharacterized membrane protein YedE/YeeE